MTFVSYAQNHEDIVLWRALSHVDEGFYIDVGAADPDQDSVTKAFYDRGWTGINLEPDPILFKNLQVNRNRDINLPLAIGNRQGEAEFSRDQATGLSTLNWDSSHSSHSSTQVVIQSLPNVWAAHVPTNQDVHFLKIDVDGQESAVLKGHDWGRLRPWIVVIAANTPLTRIENYTDWEPILTTAEYAFVYADGLNRFYVAQEHLDLKAAFRYPPNLFDNFVLASHQQQLEAVRNATQQVRNTLAAERDTAYFWWTTASQKNSELKSIHSSYFWKVYRPLSLFFQPNQPRALPNKFSQLFQRYTRKAFKVTLFRLVRLVASQPALKTRILAWIYSSPTLETKIRKIIASRQVSTLQSDNSTSLGPASPQITGIDIGFSILSANIAINPDHPAQVLDDIAYQIMLSSEARVLSLSPEER